MAGRRRVGQEGRDKDFESKGVAERSRRALLFLMKMNSVQMSGANAFEALSPIKWPLSQVVLRVPG